MSADARMDELERVIRAHRPMPGLSLHAARHLRIAMSGDKLEIARQVYEDRAALSPQNLQVPGRYELIDASVVRRWMAGELAEENKPAIAQWLTAQTARRLAIGELERRVRASLSAWRMLAQSELPEDKRRAEAFARWHMAEWQIADLPRDAAPGGDQPTEEAIRKAVALRAGR